jgi:hypothetical protein
MVEGSFDYNDGFRDIRPVNLCYGWLTADVPRPGPIQPGVNPDARWTASQFFDCIELKNTVTMVFEQKAKEAKTKTNKTQQ